VTAFAPPDVLVLGAGGVLGQAWMQGVLAGLRDASGWDARTVEAVLGTSAGAVVAASLVAGRPLWRPVEGGVAVDETAATDEAAAARADAPPRRGALDRAARCAVDWAAALTSPFAPAALAIGAPGGALLRAAILARAPHPRRRLTELRDAVAAWGSRFDGRLRVVALDRRSGRRVVFGAPSAPRAPVPDAVAASCAIPWLYAPVRIDGREYVDGAAWSVANLDAAPAGRGTRVLCLAPTAGLHAAGRPALAALRVASRTATEVEALAVRRRGARVRLVTPDGAAARLLAGDLLDPGPRDEARAAGHEQGIALAVDGR
jgi:NTE family protein